MNFGTLDTATKENATYLRITFLRIWVSGRIRTLVHTKNITVQSREWLWNRNDVAEVEELTDPEFYTLLASTILQILFFFSLATCISGFSSGTLIDMIMWSLKLLALHSSPTVHLVITANDKTLRNDSVNNCLYYWVAKCIKSQKIAFLSTHLIMTYTKKT